MKLSRPRIRLRTVLVLVALASLPIAAGMRRLRDRMESEAAIELMARRLEEYKSKYGIADIGGVVLFLPHAGGKP